MITEQVVRSALRRLKVFPLPGAVLLPGAGLPLHVFEPRYLALVEDALASDRVIAVPMLADGWEPDYTGRPALRPIAGVGVIEEDERQEDGLYNILVRGILRVRILGEHPPDKLYREVIAEPLPETAAEPAADLDTLRRVMLELGEEIPAELAGPLMTVAAQIRDPGQLGDFAAAELIEDAEVRQSVLETLDVDRRVQVVLPALGELLLKLKGAGESGPYLA